MKQQKIETGTNYKSKGQIFCNEIPKLQLKRSNFYYLSTFEQITFQNSAHVWNLSAAIFEEQRKFSTLPEFEDATRVLEMIDRHKI
jgi:hypothetical protein